MFCQAIAIQKTQRKRAAERRYHLLRVRARAIERIRHFLAGRRTEWAYRKQRVSHTLSLSTVDAAH